MHLIRPVAESDLDRLFELAQVTSFGLTTLPKDRQLLAERVADSRRGFEKIDKKPRGEAYLFVLEETDRRQVVGTSGIVSKVGGFEPFYAFRIESEVCESQTLGVRKEVRTLHLVAEHNGPCEIGSLFLAPDHRKGGLGRLLSLCRFLFMADHPDHFDPVVIAEMRGVIDERGRSPFWDAVGKHFFDIDFPKADYLSIVNKRFIADLMPKHPIYIPLLPPEAQAVIGEVHPNTEPALAMLRREGFDFTGMVDIFEAGPVVSCDRERIRAVRDSVRATVVDVTDEALQGEHQVIGNGRRAFRACLGPIAETREGVRITAECASALEVEAGDLVRYVSMRPSEPPRPTPAQMNPEPPAKGT